MSLERTQYETSSRNFLLWMVFEEEERVQKRESREKIEFYLAQIALELRRVPFAVWGKGKDFQAEIKDFLLKFEMQKKEEEPKPEPKKPAEVDYDEVAFTKAIWMTFVGLPPEVDKHGDGNRS